MTRVLRIPLLVLSLLLLAVVALPPGPARAQDSEVELERFHSELDRYGRWFAHPTHGYVWSPDVDPGWRPYTRGQWVFTEEHGWYWQSDEPFGWAVFHYGRWFLDDDSGWVWVPGTEWAPAWVAWRHSDDQVGWAPLPPEAEWRGTTLDFSSRYYDSPRYTAAWCFVPVALLTAATVYRHVHHPSRNVSYVRQTTWVPSHRFVGNRIYNVGFDRYRYERLTRRPITTVRLVDTNRPQDYGRRGRDEVRVYRPRVAVPAVRPPPPRFSEPQRRQDYLPPSRQGGWPRPYDQQRDADRPQPAQPGDQRRRWWESRPQAPAVAPPQPSATVPPPSRQFDRRLPPQQPATVTPPPQQPTTPPPQQPPQRQFDQRRPPQQPATVTPPTQQPATVPPPAVRQSPPATQPTQATPPRQQTPPGTAPPGDRKGKGERDGRKGPPAEPPK